MKSVKVLTGKRSSLPEPKTLPAPTFHARFSHTWQQTAGDEACDPSGTAEPWRPRPEVVQRGSVEGPGLESLADIADLVSKVDGELWEASNIGFSDCVPSTLYLAFQQAPKSPVSFSLSGGERHKCQCCCSLQMDGNQTSSAVDQSCTDKNPKKKQMV
ncbi:hypothetical protein H8959_018387 [Pygathrix nigripes]